MYKNMFKNEDDEEEKLLNIKKNGISKEEEKE